MPQTTPLTSSKGPLAATVACVGSMPLNVIVVGEPSKARVRMWLCDARPPTEADDAFFRATCSERATIAGPPQAQAFGQAVAISNYTIVIADPAALAVFLYVCDQDFHACEMITVLRPAPDRQNIFGKPQQTTYGTSVVLTAYYLPSNGINRGQHPAALLVVLGTKTFAYVCRLDGQCSPPDTLLGAQKIAIKASQSELSVHFGLTYYGGKIYGGCELWDERAFCGQVVVEPSDSERELIAADGHFLAVDYPDLPAVRIFYDGRELAIITQTADGKPFGKLRSISVQAGLVSILHEQTTQAHTDTFPSTSLFLDVYDCAQSASCTPIPFAPATHRAQFDNVQPQTGVSTIILSRLTITNLQFANGTAKIIVRPLISGRQYSLTCSPTSTNRVSLGAEVQWAIYQDYSVMRLALFDVLLLAVRFLVIHITRWIATENVVAACCGAAAVAAALLGMWALFAWQVMHFVPLLSHPLVLAFSLAFESLFTAGYVMTFPSRLAILRCLGFNDSPPAAIPLADGKAPCEKPLSDEDAKFDALVQTMQLYAPNYEGQTM